MAAHAGIDRTRGGLLALLVVALLLLFVATIVGGRHRGVQCSSLPQLQAEETHASGAQALESQSAPSKPPLDTQPQGAGAADDSGTQGRVRGAVVDDRVGHPVPFVTVVVRAEKQSEQLLTDSAGVFRSEQSFAFGPIELEVLDAGISYGVTRIESDRGAFDGSTVVEIRIGPTLLAGDIGRYGLGGDAGWMMRIVQTPRPLRSAGEIEVKDQELALALGPELVWSEVPLRLERKAAFARWPRVEFEPKPGFRPRVVAHSRAYCQRGAVEIEQTIGLQKLPRFETQQFLVLTGAIKTPPGSRDNLANVLVRPREDKADRFRRNRDVPDFREAQIRNGRFELEVAQDYDYTLLAWCSGGEPTRLRGSHESRGRHDVGESTIGILLQPSFDPPVFPEEFREGVRRGQQLVRARVFGAGVYARPIVDEWQAFEGLQSLRMTETRYVIESIGVDCAPATLGLSWTQNLPGFLMPDRLPGGVVARPHRIEWIDALFETARTDALVTAGPGGVIVTTREATLLNTWKVIPKSPLQFTVWKDGYEPIRVRSEDFTERGEELVANIGFRSGWGVALTFVVADSGGAPQSFVPGRKLPDVKPDKTFSNSFDYLGLPPLPGVEVRSVHANGVSDADGYVVLASRMWPDRLSLRAEGYRLRELKRMSGPGSRWIAYMEHDRYDP